MIKSSTVCNETNTVSRTKSFSDPDHLGFSNVTNRRENTRLNTNNYRLLQNNDKEETMRPEPVGHRKHYSPPLGIKKTKKEIKGMQREKIWIFCFGKQKAPK